VTGLRPIAESSTSASRVSLLPPLSSASRTPPSIGSKLFILVPVITLMPRLRNAFSRSAETSSSSIGRMRGSISISVTSEPNDRKIEANSVPTAPAPSTARVLGMRSSSRMWSELRMRSPSAGAIGMSRGTEPVAIITKRAP
jgi:hypothetical protein